MRSITLWAATAALTVSSVAVAGPNYTYAQLGFYTADSQGQEDTGGFELNGSFGFADIFHVGGGLASGEYDGGRSKQSDDANEFGADTDAYELYAGVNPAITDNIDAVVRVGYTAGEFKGRIDGDNFKLEDEALFLSFGTRAMITEKFELNAFATYSAGNTKIEGGVDDDGDSKADFVEWSYTVGGIYSFTDMFAAGIKLELENNRQIAGDVEGSPTIGNIGTLFARVNF
jgi:hypothetical protein